MSQNKNEEFDVEQMQFYMKLSVGQKLAYLEKMCRFLHKITPEKSRKIAEKLKKERF